MSFENKEIIETSSILKKQESIVRWIFNTLICSFLLNIALAGVIIFLLPLKEKKPYLMFFSNAEQNFVRVLPIGEQIRGEDALIKTLIASYVSKRETINRIDDTNRYLDVREQSSAKVWDSFSEIIKSKDSVFQEERYTRKIIIKNVAIIADQIAQVDYISEDFKDKDLETTKAFRATLQFDFDSQVMKASDVARNPLGFIVTKYTISEINENFVNTKQNLKIKGEGSKQ